MTPQPPVASPVFPTTPAWVKSAVFYQIFPDRFARSRRSAREGQPGLNLQPWGEQPTFHQYQGGDLWGVIENLDHLQHLGVTAIYFCPVFQSASNHRYHTHDYSQVDPMLGGNAALRALLDEAHRRDMKVVLDGVFNHSSRGFFQFNDLLEQGRDSAYVDWFHVQGWPLNPYDDSRPANYAAWWGNRALPKFNTNHPAVREFLWDIAEHWIRFGIDGWRLDVPNEIDDDSFWQEFRRRVKAVNPDAYIVGEIWGDAHRWLRGDQFDAVMNYHFTRPCLAFFGAHTLDHPMNEKSGTGRVEPMTAETFARRMAEVTHLYHPEIVRAQLNLLGSHDTARFLTAVGGDSSAYRLATTFQMTYVGAPCIYYGDEIGLPGGPDPDCRRAFPWDRRDWDMQTLNLTVNLIQARRGSAALQHGDFTVTHARGDHLVYRRQHGDDCAVIALNCAQTGARLPLPDQLPGGSYRDVISGQTHRLERLERLEGSDSGKSGSVHVPARGAVVLVRA